MKIEHLSTVLKLSSRELLAACMQYKIFFLATLVCCVLAIKQPALADDVKPGIFSTDIVEALKNRHYAIIMRHALAPGTGDPAEFNIKDCSTQRNLSQYGRQQAEQIGQDLKHSGIGSAYVASSQWCRCMDTAKLLGLGSVKILPEINSFFRNFQSKNRQTAATIHWLSQKLTGVPVDDAEPLILVSHQVNITALTGVFPESGELLVIALHREAGTPPQVKVIARMKTLK